MLAFRIALRYLFAPKSHKAVNVISVISVAGVATATMAIIVVLSVFNGFTDLARRHLSLIDPDVKIAPVEGKVFAGADSLARALEELPGVGAAMPVLEERALLLAGGNQMPVVFKGLEPSRVAEVIDMDEMLVDGVYAPVNGMPDSVAGAQVSVGVAMGAQLRPSAYAAAEIYVPRRLGRINPANPAAAYRSLPVAVTGVFRVDQPEYDNDYLFLPIDRVRQLLEYTSGEAGAIELRVAAGHKPEKVIDELRRHLGAGFTVKGRMEQQAETFRMIAVEKWVTFLMLVFILLIASFNIVSTLSLLVIEKRDNMATLRALGATRRMVRGVFIAEGWLITAVGGLIGTAMGIALALLQQHFGLIKLDADPSALTIDVYPVRLEWGDVALVMATVLVVGLAVAQISRIFTRKIS